MTDDSQKTRTSAWFENLQQRICAAFEAIEDAYAAALPGAAAGRFERIATAREGGGAGVMAVMRGRVFEKVGANVTTAWGEFSPEFRGQIPSVADKPRLRVSGTPLVAQMT